MSSSGKDAPDIERQRAEPVPDREMMSLLSGSTSSLLPGTTEGSGAATDAAGTASDAPSTTDDVSVPSTDASGSSSQPVVTSDDDVSESFHSADTVTSET